MNPSHQLKNGRTRFLKIVDRIFFWTLVGQLIVASLMYLGFAGGAILASNSATEQKIRRLFTQVEKSLTESIYIEEVLTNGRDTYFTTESPALKALQASIRGEGLDAKVKIAPCQDSDKSTLKIPLTIGNRALNHCLYVKSESGFFSYGIWLMFLAGTLSMLVISGVWLLLRQNLKRHVLDPLMEKIDAKSKKEVMGMLAAQVAHDVRSPLSALNMIAGSLNEISEEKRILIRNSVQRINDIANDLLTKRTPARVAAHLTRSPGSKISTSSECLLAVEIERLVSEKRLQYHNNTSVEISVDVTGAHGLFVKIDIKEFRRALSNLVNNSVESLVGKSGYVKISISGNKEGIKVKVRDNGRGIPPEILVQLGEAGVTTNSQMNIHGKGSGLGIYHAKNTVESVGGFFQIESLLNFGTSVTMRFSCIQTPIWFVDKLLLQAGTTIVAVDDDPTIHSLWTERFKDTGVHKFGIELLRFSNGIEFESWYIKVGKHLKNALFLMDFELLNQKKSGLDIIEDLQMAEKSILVSSRYEETNLRERCEKINLRQLPKGIAGLIPIEVLLIGS